MPIVRLEDEHGNKIKVLKSERFGDSYTLSNFTTPGFNQEQEIALWDTWKAREDDVLLCAYPKSGTHWLWEIVGMLLNGSSDRIKAIKENWMLEGISKEIFDNLSSPRIINTHIYYKHLPLDFRKRGCKIIYVMRNPKDVAVSFYNHHSKILDYEYNAEWKDYLPRFIKGDVDYGSWFNYIIDWEKEMNENQDNPAHFVTYEDLHTDCVQEIRRLAKFLNVPENESLFKSVADACNFDKMKKDKDSMEDTSEWKDQKPGMYRKGKVGDWKNWFTVAQSEMFDRVCAERLKNMKIPLQYETI